jgi:excisionase family DNA binding protein
MDVVDRIGSIEELLAGASGEDARRLARAVASSECLEWTTVDDGRVVFTARGAHLIANLLETLAEGHAVVISEAEKLISPGEAAQILGVSRPTVVKWIRAGELTDFPVGAQHRLDHAEVLRVLARRRAVAELAREQARRALQTGADATAGADEVFAAAVLARKGDDDQLERQRGEGLAARARAAAAAARKDPGS